MKIFVNAKPNAREEHVVKIDDTNFEVCVKEPPRQGRANAAIIKALADFLHIVPSSLRLRAGYTSRKKIIEVLSTPQKTTGLPVDEWGFLERDSAPRASPVGLDRNGGYHGLARGAS